MEQLIKLEFTVAEVNAILSILAQRPYIETAQYIHKIHQQAHPQLPPPEDQPANEAAAD